jgi:hypothetical protein
MNEKIKEILNEMEDELIENGCFHELDSWDDVCIIFNYPNYWDSYPEFASQIELETENILALENQLKEAGFSGFFWVNDYVKHINI